MKRLRFGTNTLAALLTSIAIQVLGWVGTKTIYLNEVHGATNSPGAGLLGLATFFVMVSSIIVGLGAFKIGTAYTFFIARGAPKRTLTGTYLLFHAMSFTSLSALVIGLAIHFNWFPGYDSALSLFLFLPVVGIPAGVFTTLRNAEGRTAIGQIPVLVQGVVQMVLIVFFALQFSSRNMADPSTGHAFVFDIALSYFLGGVAGMLVSLPVLREVSFRRFLPTLKDLSSYALPLMGAMFFTYAAGMIVPIVVNYLTGTTVMLYYTSDNAFLILLMFIPSAVCTPLFPDLAGMHVRGEDEALRLRIRQSVRYTLMLLTPAMMAVAVFRVDLLNIFYSGAVLEYGAPALIVFAATALPTALFRITGTALDAVGLQKRELYISFAQLVVVVGATWFLVPRYFVLGAAAAVLISMTVGVTMNAYWMHRYLPVSFPVRAILTVIFASLFTFALFSESFLSDLDIHLPVNKWYVLFPIMAGGLFLYMVILAAVGELTKQDVVDLVRTAGLPDSLGKLLSKICWRDSWPVEGHPIGGPDL